MAVEELNCHFTVIWGPPPNHVLTLLGVPSHRLRTTAFPVCTHYYFFPGLLHNGYASVSRTPSDIPSHTAHALADDYLPYSSLLTCLDLNLTT